MNYSYNLDSVYHYEKDSMAISFRPAVSIPHWIVAPAALSDAPAHRAEKDSVCSETAFISSRSGTPVTQTLSISTANNLMATVFPRDTLVIERWHTRFKDHETVKTDTLKVTEYQTITETQKYIPRFYKWCTLFFWMLVILFLGYLIFRIMKAIYLRQ